MCMVQIYKEMLFEFVVMLEQNIQYDQSYIFATGYYIGYITVV